MTTTATTPEHVRVLILGSGPAGYTCGIYAGRANLQPVIYQGIQPGGQLTTTTEIENFPGYPQGTTGNAMMDDLRQQAQRFGADVRDGIATRVDFGQQPKRVWIDDRKEILADTVIIATGATARYLGLESEARLRGSGVSACATCDGFFYKGLDVAVVGGGDTACEEAIYLAGLCRKVYLVVRKNYLRASQIMRERVEATANIEILYEHRTKEVLGKDEVEGALLVKGTPESGETEVRIDIAGFFLAIGHQPNSAVFSDFVDCDAEGYIITQAPTTATNVAGVFACGDIIDHHYRQAITAAASGCKAAIDAERWLAANPS